MLKINQLQHKQRPIDVLIDGKVSPSNYTRRGGQEVLAASTTMDN